MDSTVVAVIPRKFPKEQATRKAARRVARPATRSSQGDEAETNKKN
ncbi:MAG: hypothetical protein WCD13_09025 [Pseudolabrys sp.]